MTFKSISYAMRFESVMKENKITIKLIPVPRSISTSCGICAKMDCKEIDAVKALIVSYDLKVDGTYTYFE